MARWILTTACMFLLVGCIMDVRQVKLDDEEFPVRYISYSPFLGIGSGMTWRLIKIDNDYKWQKIRGGKTQRKSYSE